MSEASVGLNVVVVANGELLHPMRLLSVVDGADAVIAADGGANWLCTQNRVPNLVVGDMDSVSPEVLRYLAQHNCTLQRHEPTKDETDTELALKAAAALGAARITILGALGGRIDHALANVSLLAMPELEGIDVVIFDGLSFLSMARGGVSSIAGRAGDIVSLIPWGGDAKGVTTEGLQYSLDDALLRGGAARGVSNVLLESVGRVALRQGHLLIVHTPSRDPEPLDAG